MIQKVTITETSLKDGKSAANKEWTKLGIRTKEYGDKWLSCFLTDFNKERLLKIQKDDVMELVVEPSGEYLNFKIPGQYDRLDARVTALETIINKLPHNVGVAVVDTSMEDINPDDIPF